MRRMIYNLVLENLCTGVTGFEDTEEGHVATFVYSRFPVYLDSEGQVLSEVKQKMVVKLNLSSADLSVPNLMVSHVLSVMLSCCLRTMPSM